MAYHGVHHGTFLGNTQTALSFITELNFEQPRALAKGYFITNISGHVKNVKSK